MSGSHLHSDGIFLRRLMSFQKAPFTISLGNAPPPRLWKGGFKGGPHEVRLEFDIIQAYLTYWKIDDSSEVYYEYFAHALEQTRKLRNAVSHFVGQWWDGDEYDEHLKYAQALAVAVGDVSRSEGARALRDELRAVAEEMQREMEDIGSASGTPVRRDWAPHHESFFRKFISTGEGDLGTTINGFEYPPKIVLALKAWRWQQETEEETEDTGTPSLAEDKENILEGQW